MDTLATPSALNMIPSVVNPETKTLTPRGRIKTVAAALGVFQTDWNADLASTYERAKVQQMIDGMPPYSVGNDKKSGYSGRTNVNWGLGSQSHDEAVLPYNTILESIDDLGYFPTNHGTEQERLTWEPIIAEGITRMLKKWPRFHPLWQQNANIFVAEGLAFAFFEDDMNWQWEVKGQQYFKYPRRVVADIEQLDRISCKVQMLPASLYKHVSNPEVATEEGWNPEEVKKALIQCTSQHSMPTNDWQEWEKSWKENDMNFSNTTATVEVIQMWVKELDRTVSHYIFRSDGGGDFLYKRLGKFKCMSRVVLPYFYGVGSNGDFQSIRGHGQRVFNQCMAINRLLCKSVDSAVHQATPHLQLQTEDQVMEAPMRPMGPYIAVDPGVTFPEIKMPDFGQSLGPIIESLTGILISRQRSYTASSSGLSNNTEKTKYQQMTENEQSGRLSTGGMTLFFMSWEMHLKEVVRRIINPEYTAEHPGGAEVWSFITWCQKRGVPIEAIRKIDVDGIEVNMGIGKGSAQERRVALDGLRGMYYLMDQEAQNVLNQQTAASWGGTRIAKLLFPDKPGMRPPVDYNIALLENAALVSGQPVYILPTQDANIHLQAHLPRLAELNNLLLNQQATVDQVIPQMTPLWEHSMEHLQSLDPNDPAAAQYRQALQELNEIITNGQKQIFKQQQDAQEQGNAEMASPNGLVQAAQVAASQKFLEQEADHQQKLQHREDEFRQKLALRDAETAAKLRTGLKQ